MVGVRLGDFQEHFFAGRVGLLGALRNRKAGDGGVALSIGVIDIESRLQRDNPGGRPARAGPVRCRWSGSCRGCPGTGFLRPHPPPSARSGRPVRRCRLCQSRPRRRSGRPVWKGPPQRAATGRLTCPAGCLRRGLRVYLGVCFWSRALLVELPVLRPWGPKWQLCGRGGSEVNTSGGREVVSACSTGAAGRQAQGQEQQHKREKGNFSLEGVLTIKYFSFGLLPLKNLETVQQERIRFGLSPPALLR